MGNLFRRMKLSEIGQIVAGGTPKTKIEEYWNGDVPWITPKDLSSHAGMYISRGERNISQVGLDNSSAKLLPKGTVLFTSRAPIGYVAIARNEVTTNQGFKSIISDDENDNIFIYYLLKNNIDLIENHANGSTFKEISGSVMKSLEFGIPSLREQKAIAHILSTLDEKIEVNNQINKTLENMAQAIFKQWFVDFEFSNEDGEPYKSSGGEMIDSELGEIPEGGETVKLGDYVEVKYGKDHKKLVEGDFPVYGSGGIMRYVDTFLYSGESVLIPRKGTLGNVMYVNEAFWSVDTMFYTVMRTRNIAKFIYLFLNRIDLKSMNVGSAVPSMTTNILNNMKIIKPPSQILEQFDSLIAPMFQMIKHNKEENKTLEDIRDALLPKLLSGDLELGGLLDEE